MPAAEAAISPYVWWYGRDEPPQESRLLRAGPVSARLVGRDLRNLRYGGTEVAQRIYVAVRDRNWDTVPGDIIDLTLEESSDRFTVVFTTTHRQRDIDFTWRGEIVGSADGTISYAMDAVAGRDMTYKLIGLNIHHGMREYAGRACEAITPDGSIADAFSTDVAPQLVVDETEVPIFPPVESITAHLADGVSVRFDFAGDTFEFEDQRNWTDASFKSQSYPPRRGGFSTIRAGEHVWQQVTITPSGTPAAAVREEGPIRLELGELMSTPIPPIGFGMASHGRRLSEAEAALFAALRPDHLRADLRLADAGYRDELARASADATALGCGLELALHLTDDAERQLADVVPCLGSTPRIDRIFVFHEAELATNPRWVDLARDKLREAAPAARFAGGTNANFCELNRFRPDYAPGVGIVYSINPQIHAFDDLSLTENIAAQAETVQTARAFSPGHPILVSPVTLKPRFNAVATSEAPAPAPGELPPQVDPRQMSLFAAGWTIGSLRHLIESGVDAATYYETTGWRGVMQGDEPSPAPQRFITHAGMVFPMYHVFADLAEWKTGSLISSRSGDPLAVETLAVANDGGRRLLVANLTPERQRVRIDGVSGEVRVRRLHAATADLAASNPASFRARAEQATAPEALELALEPFEIARIDIPGPARP